MDNQFYRKEKKGFDVRGGLKKLLKNRRAMVGLIIGIPLALYLLLGSRGVLQRVRLQNQKTELEAKIREADAETRRLQSESKALDGDRKEIEKVAREQHGMVREGETVYKVNRKQ